MKENEGDLQRWEEQSLMRSDKKMIKWGGKQEQGRTKSVWGDDGTEEEEEEEKMKPSEG